LYPASGLKTITSSKNGLQIFLVMGTTLVVDFGMVCFFL